MTKMFSRAGRASLLDRKAFTEAFFDDDAPADSAILVSLVAAAVYVGTLVRVGVLGVFSIADLFQVVIAGVVSWLVLGFATWFVANRLFGASSRPQTMIGLQGLAVLPLLLEIFGSAIGGLGLVWYLVILVVATREATDLKLRDAAVSVLIGFAVAALFRALLSVPFAALGALF
ncbi:MAG: YIP1 family protein [Actinomycetota bacterium]|nr:YIP1 family protein [Actinomycetota bacterium]